LLALDAGTRNDNDNEHCYEGRCYEPPTNGTELDPAVVQVAKQYFGAAAAPRHMTRGRLESGRVGNGLFVCAANDEHAATLADAILTTSRSPSGHH
jgi:hypothetical protein